MSFFARAANLIKGGIRSIGRTDPMDELRLRAIEAELAKAEAPRTVRVPEAKKPEPPLPERPAPVRDETGAVKRTL